VARRERDILERAVQAIAEQAKKANAIVNEAHAAGLERLTSRDTPSENAASRAADALAE
jgi:hypothetical protein